LRFHGQASLTDADAGAAVTPFLQFVESLIPKDKFQTFLSLFRFPVKTVELAEEIYTAIEKLFDGRDPVFRYEFTNPELSEDWKEYRHKNLGGQRFWKTRAYEAMKTAINSIMVVDLPPEQSGPAPEPYYYLLDIASVLEYEIDKDGGITWLAFRQGTADDWKIAVFDDESYRVYQSKDGATDLGQELANNPHGLGYVPAKWFWDQPITYREPERKKAPVTSQLDNLDKYLFTAISKQHLDLYAAYPIYWGFAQDCDYREDSGFYCDGGFLRDEANLYAVSRGGTLAKCPACSEKRLTGAGSFIEVPPPGPHNDGANLRDPVGKVGADRPSLDYNTEEVARQRLAIYRQVVGFGGDPINDQAINEKQVMASFEGRAQRLREIAKNFEIAQKWADETAARLRYGALFTGASISYGTEFYLYSADEVILMYQEAKAAGLDDVVLDMLQEQFWATKYRNNPEAKQRADILLNLEPFRHLSKQEVREMYAADQIEYEDFFLKQNFSSLIMRFERENTDVLSFGSLLDFDAKIDAIRETILTYVTQNESDSEPDAGDGREPGDREPEPAGNTAGAS
jgi:hypothetical protein